MVRAVYNLLVKTTLGAALLLASAAAAADPYVDAPDYGPFGVVGAVSVETTVPLSPLGRLVNSGAAVTRDGSYLQWRAVWSGSQIVSVDQFRQGPTPPLRGASASILPDELPGRSACHLVAEGVTVRGRLGAWNCAGALGTLLGAVGSGGRPVVLASLPRRYQGMVAETTPHTGSSRVVLAAFDPDARRFDLIELSLGPEQ